MITITFSLAFPNGSDRFTFCRQCRRTSAIASRVHESSSLTALKKLIVSCDSIVAVHGLDGDPISAWTHSGSGAYWIKDLLSLDVPGACVLSFGYNANTVFGNTTADILDHAKDLLGSLLDKREKPDVRGSDDSHFECNYLVIS